MDFVFPLLGLLSSFSLFPFVLYFTVATLWFSSFLGATKTCLRPFFTQMAGDFVRLFFKKNRIDICLCFLLCRSKINKATGILFQLLTKDETEDIMRCCKHEFFLQVIRSWRTSTSVSFGNQSERCFHPISMQNDKNNKPDWKIFSLFPQCKTGIVFMGCN